MKDDNFGTFQFPISKYAKLFSSIFCILSAMVIIFGYGEALLYRNFNPMLFGVSLLVTAIFLFIFLHLLSKEISTLIISDEELQIKGFRKVRIYKLREIKVILYQIGSLNIHWVIAIDRKNKPLTAFRKFFLREAFFISVISYIREVKPLIELLEEKGVLKEIPKSSPP
jgi:hypothetical protein